MSVDDRRNTCLKARFCLRCVDKDVIFNVSHAKKCKVTKTDKLPITWPGGRKGMRVDSLMRLVFEEYDVGSVRWAVFLDML